MHPLAKLKNQLVIIVGVNEQATDRFREFQVGYSCNVDIRS